MLSKSVRFNVVLRVTLRTAHISSSVPKATDVIKGDEGLLGHKLGPYYTSNLDLIATMGMVSGFDAIVRRAIADDLKFQSPTSDMDDQTSTEAYLKRISTTVENFRASGGVVGRQREREMIAKYFQTKGTMAFICGGPSVGKTKLLDDIIKVDMKTRNSEGGAGPIMPLRVVRFDGRAVNSLHKVLQQEVDIGASANVKMPLSGGSEAVAVADCVTALWEQAQKDGSHVVVVLDEANAFLQTTDVQAAKDTVKLFNTLVLHTKQTSHMSVILLSSDEALPFRLEHLGLNATHLQETLVVGGAAPQEMLNQLEELGVGPNLRDLLVRIYGGHVWQVDVALNRLSRALQAGDEADVLRGPMDSIGNAFALWEAQKGDRSRLVDVLVEVARFGFSPLGKDDALSRVLTKSNACTFLAHDTMQFFIDPKVRLKRSGVTASTQLTRVLIPVALQERNLLPDRGGVL